MKAYLVLTLDTAEMPPTVVSAGIFSSPAHGLTKMTSKPRLWVTALEAYHPESYQKAKETLHGVMRAHPSYRWLVPVFDFERGEWAL